jgi:hypothetical protein
VTNTIRITSSRAPAASIILPAAPSAPVPVPQASSDTTDSTPVKAAESSDPSSPCHNGVCVYSPNPKSPNAALPNSFMKPVFLIMPITMIAIGIFPQFL